MEGKLGQEPAFPKSKIKKTRIDGKTKEFITEESSGISKRFYAACCAINGFTANSETIKDLSKVAKEENLNVLSIIAKMSFEMADELLKQENK